MGIEEGTEIKIKSIDKLFNNIVAENVPYFEEGRDIQVQRAFRTTNRQVQKRNTTRHIISKTLNVYNKEKILKPATEKQQVI
jgi:hypothetical protein